MKKILENLPKLRNLAKGFNLLFIYLFGSSVSGKTGPLSDIDIAVYFNEKISQEKFFNLRLKLISELMSLFKTNDIDVVILNETHPLLENRILKEGQLLYSADEKKRANYEARAFMKYFDFLPFIEKHTSETLGK